jgi:hypothetical protein
MNSILRATTAVADGCQRNATEASHQPAATASWGATAREKEEEKKEIRKKRQEHMIINRFLGDLYFLSSFLPFLFLFFSFLSFFFSCSFFFPLPGAEGCVAKVLVQDIELLGRKHAVEVQINAKGEDQAGGLELRRRRPESGQPLDRLVVVDGLVRNVGQQRVVPARTQASKQARRKKKKKGLKHKHAQSTDFPFKKMEERNTYGGRPSTKLACSAFMGRRASRKRLWMP